MHFVQDTNGSVQLRCTSPFGEYLTKGMISLVCLFFLSIGLRQLLPPLLRPETIFGLTAAALGGGGLFAVWQDDWSGSEFDAVQRVARLRDPGKTGMERVIFDRIQQVQIQSGGRSQFSFSIVKIFTDHESYSIVEGWEMWQAEDLAQRIGSLVQCPVLNVHGERLPHIARAELKPKPKRPTASLAERILTGVFFSIIAALVINVGYIWYQSARPLNQPLALSGPTAIAVNQQGELHLYSSLLDRIQIFNPNGEFQQSVGTGEKEGKRGANLCGGGEHPVFLESISSSRRALYEVQSTNLTYRKTKRIPKFCRKSRNRSVVAWQDKLYIIRDWPQRVVSKQRGQVEQVIIPGNWGATIAGMLLLILGPSVVILALAILIGLFFKIRHDSVK